MPNDHEAAITLTIRRPSRGVSTMRPASNRGRFRGVGPLRLSRLSTNANVTLVGSAGSLLKTALRGWCLSCGRSTPEDRPIWLKRNPTEAGLLAQGWVIAAVAAVEFDNPLLRG
jgi:hypothetical protein